MSSTAIRSLSSLGWLFFCCCCCTPVLGETRTIQSFGNITFGQNFGGKKVSSPLVIAANDISGPIYSTIRGSGYIQFNDFSFSYPAEELITTNDSDSDNYLYIDVIIIALKEKKKKNSILLKNWDSTAVTSDKEDWLYRNVGIGATTKIDDVDASSDYFLCCTDDALKLGLCDAANYGRLIVSQPHKLRRHTTIESPRGSINNGTIKNTGLPYSLDEESGIITAYPFSLNAMEAIIPFEYSSEVALLIANCNMTTTTSTSTLQSLKVRGDVIWLSYMSSESIGFALLWTCIHIGLVVWYRYQMLLNRANRIQVESWIYYVLLLASLDALFNLGYQVLEVNYSTSDNNSIHEYLFWRDVSDVITTTARVVSRCLYVAIALGLGVIKTKLSTTTRLCLLTFGGTVWIIELIADGIGDVSFLLQDEDFFSPPNQVRELMNQVSFYINTIFLLWIPYALRSTMKSIRCLPNEMGMEHKLKRYQWLLSIYFLSLGCTFFMIVLFIWDMINSGGKNFDLSSFDDGNHIIYLIVLACMAVLWKPNPMAPMYGYQLLQDDNDEFDNDNNIVVEMVESDNNNATSIMKQQQQPKQDSSGDANKSDFDLSLQVEDGQ